MDGGNNLNEGKDTFGINLLIMITPLVLPAGYFLVLLGESFLFFAIPLVVSLFTIVDLATSLGRKDAISYPFVQYPFLLLLYGLVRTHSYGLAFVIVLPLVFIVNMSMGYVYFRFAKRKRWFTKILVFLLTIAVCAPWL